MASLSSKFGHQMAPPALVSNLATRWRHLHKLQIWPPDGTTCITYKFSYQAESLALPHCLGLPYWHYQLVLSLYLHQPESHQFSLQKVLDSVSEWERTGPIDRTPGTPGSDKKHEIIKFKILLRHCFQPIPTWLKTVPSFIRHKNTNIPNANCLFPLTSLRYHQVSC